MSRYSLQPPSLAKACDMMSRAIFIWVRRRVQANNVDALRVYVAERCGVYE
jgi:hypothetical protein